MPATGARLRRQQAASATTWGSKTLRSPELSPNSTAPAAPPLAHPSTQRRVGRPGSREAGELNATTTTTAAATPCAASSAVAAPRCSPPVATPTNQSALTVLPPAPPPPCGLGAFPSGEHTALPLSLV
jgi:hypothetical protein